MIELVTMFSFQVHGGGLGGGLAASLLDFFDFVDKLFGKPPSEMFDFLFPGIAELDNIHPLFVHYPIAFFTAFFVFECLGLLFKKSEWRYLASWLLYLGTLSALFTVMAGLFAADSVEHDEAVHNIMESHEHFGITVLSIGFGLSIWRMKGWLMHSKVGNAVFLTISAILCLVLMFGADLGGLMVYRYGVAVSRSETTSAGLPSSGKNGEILSKKILKDTSDEHNHGGGHSHGGHSHSHSGHDHGGHQH
jgi:uncharacterized membrane protein